MGWIYRGLSGEEDLWKIFWIYGVFFIFLAKVLIVVLRLTTGIDFDQPRPTQAHILFVAQMVYSAWFIIAAWRCALCVEKVVWAYVMRSLILLYLLFVGAVYYYTHSVFEPLKAINKGVEYARTVSNTYQFKRSGE